MAGKSTGWASLLIAGVLCLPMLAQGREPPAASHMGGPRGPAPRMNFDNRYHHDHYYPHHGVVVRSLPPGARSIYYNHHRYFMRGGVWYRPYGPRWMVFAPPIGLVVPFLPEFYTTVWFGGVPYYYANDTYYLWNRGAGGYVVSSPPSSLADQNGQDGSASTGSGAGDDIYVYPRNGQSEAQTAKDRFECHQWAVSQTGFDPSEPGGGVPAEQNAGKRADYRRAISACLEGRQYSVR